MSEWRPSVSVVIPHFEGLDYIFQTVRSALAQLSSGDECVIADDGSSTETFRRLLELESLDPRVRIVRSDVNRGGASARNHAVRAATNDWLFCLDADNLLSQGLIDVLIAGATRGGLDVAVPQFTLFVDSRTLIPTHAWRYEITPVLLDHHVVSEIVPSSSGNYLFSRRSWEQVGGYLEASGSLDAWTFGFRQVAHGYRMAAVEGTFYIHRYGHHSYWMREARHELQRSAFAYGIMLQHSHGFSDGVRHALLSTPGRLHWALHPRSAFRVKARIEPAGKRIEAGALPGELLERFAAASAQAVIGSPNARGT